MVGQRGMTLVEVMVATVIIVPALYGIMQLVPNVIAANRKAEDITKAAYLAEQKLEEIKRGIKVPGGGGWINYTNSSPEVFTPPDSQYKFSLEDNTPGGPAGSLKDLKVTVWRDVVNNNFVDNNEYSVVLDTRVARSD